MHKKRISLNSVEKSLSHSADKIRRRTLLCFERILVSKNFKQRRGEASRFCRKFFHLTGPKKLRQGSFLCFRKFLVGKNTLWIRGGLSRFSVEIFMFLSAQNFRKGILLFLRKFLVSKSFMDEKGVSHFSVENFGSHSADKILYRNPLVFH